MKCKYINDWTDLNHHKTYEYGKMVLDDENIFKRWRLY